MTDEDGLSDEGELEDGEVLSSEDEDGETAKVCVELRKAVCCPPFFLCVCVVREPCLFSLPVCLFG